MSAKTGIISAVLSVLPLLLCGGSDRLQQENQQLRSRIIALESELAAIRQWLGGMTVDPLDISAGAREKRALLALKEFSRRGNALVLESAAVADEFRQVIAALPAGPARKAQLQLQIDALENAARKFSALSIPGNDTIRSCRVLAVNRELRVAVISAGSSEGVVPGMVFHPSGRENIRLRVISVRYEGALAEITIYNADGTVYGTASDSIESCCARSSGDLFVALMKFADSARKHLYNK